MRKITIAAALCAAFAVGAPAYASGPASASAFWADPYHRSADQRALDLQQAEAQERARTGGYGPGLSTTNYNGTVNSYSTYNGPVVSSGSTNIVNSNSTSSTVSGSSGVTLTVSTGQTSGSAVQQAGSEANSAGGAASFGGINQGPRR